MKSKKNLDTSKEIEKTNHAALFSSKAAQTNTLTPVGEEDTLLEKPSDAQDTSCCICRFFKMVKYVIDGILEEGANANMDHQMDLI
jgi:hypothetical protein